MNNPSYITKNPEELFSQAPPEIQALILGNEVNNATAVLGRLYKIPISSYVGLENIISYLLIGALTPENAVGAIVDILKLPEEEAVRLATDLDKTILEKARIKILGKSSEDLVELTFNEGRSPDELRKEILDTTKRGSTFTEGSEVSLEPTALQELSKMPEEKPLEQAVSVSDSVPAPEQVKKKFEVAPGSRSQLLEQLQVLGEIPNDDEILERLSKIHEQIASMDKKDSSTLETKVPLQQFMFGEKGDEAVTPEMKLASYSKAPTKYNIDPYRETAEES